MFSLVFSVLHLFACCQQTHLLIRKIKTLNQYLCCCLVQLFVLQSQYHLASQLCIVDLLSQTNIENHSFALSFAPYLCPHFVSLLWGKRELSIKWVSVFCSGRRKHPPHVYLKLVFGVLVEISPSCTEEAPTFHIHIAIKENQTSKVSMIPKWRTEQTVALWWNPNSMNSL